MGRSRAVSQAADDDSSQSRSKRKRTASSAENLDSASNGSGMADGKGALYHCNYCNKDISGKIRIKCAVCPDFDLCIECFSVGAEVTPHKSIHSYRVMDNLSFPLICPDWNADEEMLLLEGIEMYGLGNWTEVAEHVGTKKKSECIDHYNSVYMNSPCFPLPDLSHVMGKSRDELLAMAKEHDDSKKGTLGEVKKEESSFTAGIKIEDSRKEGPGHLSPAFNGGVGSSGGKTSMVAVKRASSKTQNKDNRGNSKDDTRSERTTGEKKLKLTHNETPLVTEVNGYNIKRQEFEIEYDNDAEQLLTDMEFKDTDTAAETELKLRVLRIYWKRLDERKRRKEFVLERGLLYPDLYEKTLSPEEKEIYNKYKVFMRFLPMEEYEDMVKTAIEEHRILKRIHKLQEARAAGCRTSAEARRYIEHKTKEAEESAAKKEKANNQPGPGGKALMRANHIKGEFDGSPLSGLNVGRSLSSSIDVWDITGFPGEDLLSDAEKQLCREIRILPAHYLSMMQTISIGMLNGSITQKSDAHPLFKVDPNKVDSVYDELLKKGFRPQ